MVKKSWPFSVIILLVFLFFWKVFFLHQVPIPADFVVGVYYPWLDYSWTGFPSGVPVKNPILADIVSFSYPMRILGVDLIKNWQWPLWNKYILTGTPLLANFQSAPFSPTNFVYFLFDNLTAWSIQIMLQHILAAVFVFLLLRHWKVSKLGSLMGGVIFAFSGFNLIFSQWNAHTLAAAFIPLLLLLEDKWFTDGKYKYGFWFSFVLALQILSGYPQIVMYSLISTLILWLVRMKLTTEWFVKTIQLGVFGILGLGLSAFQILPGAELLANSQRAAEPTVYIWSHLPWFKVITFLAPDFFGNPSTANYWGPQDYLSNTGFVGVVAFMLSLLSLNLISKKYPVKFSLSLAIVSLVIVFPTPLAVAITNSNLIGMKSAVAHRGLVLWNLAIALMAGFGVDYYIKHRIGIRSRLYLFLPHVLLGVSCIFALYIFHTTGGSKEYVVALRNLVIPGAILMITTVILLLFRAVKTREVGAYLLCCLLVFELFRFGWKFTPFSPRHIIFPKTPTIEFLESQEGAYRVTGNKVIPMNMQMSYGLETPEGYEAVFSSVIAKYIATLNEGTSSASIAHKYGFVNKENSRLLDLINTKYYIVLKKDAKGSPDPNGQVPEVYQKEKFDIVHEDKSVVVLESREALDRAFMVYDWQTQPDDIAVLDGLLDASFPIKKKVFVDKQIEGEPSSEIVKNTVLYHAGPQGSQVEVDTNKAGLLFVSDFYYPGWKATIDGEETEIIRANYAFRAVYVPAGKHNLVFEYRPKLFFNGLKLSLASVIVLIGLCFFFN